MVPFRIINGITPAKRLSQGVVGFAFFLKGSLKVIFFKLDELFSLGKSSWKLYFAHYG
jgi:hypothetical protein